MEEGRLKKEDRRRKIEERRWKMEDGRWKTAERWKLIAIGFIKIYQKRINIFH
jgi:hypothetical protein